MAVNKIKGLTVEIGGDTTKLGQALESVNKKSADLSRELGEINRLLKLDPGNADLLAQKQKVLAEAVATTSEKLRTLREAERQVQKQFERGEVSEAQLRELQREIITTEKKLKGYEDAARDTAEAVEKMGDSSADVKSDTKKAEKGADDAADALDDLSKSAGKTEKAGSKMGAALSGVAAKGAKAVAAAAAAAGAAVGALATAAVSAANAADEVLTLSSVTGIATDDLQAFKYAAELVDVDLDTLTKSLARNTKSMASAQQGSALYADAYRKLGVAVTDANGELRDGETVYWETLDALGKMTNETERDAIAMQLFGRSAQELNPLIEAGADKLQALTQEAREVGAVMGTETLDALGEFDDTMQRLKGTAGAAKNALGGVLLPELQLLAGTGTELLADFNEQLNASGGGLDGLISTIDSMQGEIVDAVSELAIQLVEKVAALLPTLVDTFASLFQSVVGKVTELAPTLVTALVDVVGTALTAVIDLHPQVAALGASLTLELISGITSLLPQVAEAFAEMAPLLLGVLADTAPRMLDAAIGLIGAVCDAILIILPRLADEAPKLAMTIIDLILEAVPLLLDAAVELLTSILDALPIVIGKLVPRIPEIASAIVLGLLDCIPELLDAAVTLMLAIVEAIPLICVELVKALPQIWATMYNHFKQMPGKLWAILASLVQNVVKWGVESTKAGAKGALNLVKAIVDAVKGISTQMISVGKNLVSGLWQGMNNSYTWLKNKIRSWVGNVTEFLKSLFGIHSPSRVTAYMGEMLDAGLAEGIEDNTAEPMRAMRGLSDDLLDEGPDGLTLTRQINNSFGASGAAAFSGADMLGKLDQILAAIQAGQVIALDGKALIGSTAAGYDTTLGQRKVLAARGAL